MRLIFWFLVRQFRQKKALTDRAIPLDRDNLPGLVSNFINAINKLERKKSGKGIVRAGERFTLFLLNEDSCVKMV